MNVTGLKYTKAIKKWSCNEEPSRISTTIEETEPWDVILTAEVAIEESVIFTPVLWNVNINKNYNIVQREQTHTSKRHRWGHCKKG